MDTLIELLTTAGRFLVGIWPVMFVFVLVGIVKRKYGFSTALRTSIKALVLAWVIFAILRALFIFLKMDTFHLIQEPLNSRAFLLVGLALLPLVFALVLEERRKQHVIRSIEDMQVLLPSEFEELVAKTLRAQGHTVEVVGATGDHGIDLIVHAANGETWLAQCKKYRGKVGEPVVRDFYGVLRASDADAGILVTSGLITPQARLWAEGKPLQLYDGRALLTLIESTHYNKILPSAVLAQKNHQPAKPAEVKSSAAPAPMSFITPSPKFTQDYTDEPKETLLADKTPFMNMSNVPDCPACGTPMVVHTSRRFFFFPQKKYICANTPECQETMTYE